MTRTTFKSRLRKRLARAPLRYLAAPLFDGLVRTELSVIRCWDEATRSRPASASEYKQVTAIIKTFERPQLLERLVASLERCFPGLAIIVADDSRTPSRLPRVQTVELPFDSGVSAGRQAALDAVRTRLTWVFDDDFVVYRGTRLGLALRALEREPELDLVGGRVVDLPLFSSRGSARNLVYPTPASPRLTLGTRLGEVIVCDKVPNFFVARTDKLRQVGWDARLKRMDHADFFTRARGVLAVGFLARFACLHAQAPFDSAYMARRDDYAADEALLRARYFLEG